MEEEEENDRKVNDIRKTIMIKIKIQRGRKYKRPPDRNWERNNKIIVFKNKLKNQQQP